MLNLATVLFRGRRRVSDCVPPCIAQEPTSEESPQWMIWTWSESSVSVSLRPSKRRLCASPQWALPDFRECLLYLVCVRLRSDSTTGSFQRLLDRVSDRGVRFPGLENGKTYRNHHGLVRKRPCGVCSSLEQEHPRFSSPRRRDSNGRTSHRRVCC